MAQMAAREMVRVLSMADLAAILRMVELEERVMHRPMRDIRLVAVVAAGMHQRIWAAVIHCMLGQVVQRDK
jgi:repressor of nif and glnA expression